MKNDSNWWYINTQPLIRCEARLKSPKTQASLCQDTLSLTFTIFKDLMIWFSDALLRFKPFISILDY